MKILSFLGENPALIGVLLRTFWPGAAKRMDAIAENLRERGTDMDCLLAAREKIDQAAEGEESATLEFSASELDALDQLLDLAVTPTRKIRRLTRQLQRWVDRMDESRTDVT